MFYHVRVTPCRVESCIKMEMRAAQLCHIETSVSQITVGMEVDCKGADS